MSDAVAGAQGEEVVPVGDLELLHLGRVVGEVELVVEVVEEHSPPAPPARHAEAVVGRARALDRLGGIVGGEADVRLAGLADGQVAGRADGGAQERLDCPLGLEGRGQHQQQRHREYLPDHAVSHLSRNGRGLSYRRSKRHQSRRAAGGGDVPVRLRRGDPAADDALRGGVLRSATSSSPTITADHILGVTGLIRTMGLLGSDGAGGALRPRGARSGYSAACSPSGSRRRVPGGDRRGEAGRLPVPERLRPAGLRHRAPRRHASAMRSRSISGWAASIPSRPARWACRRARSGASSTRARR